MVDADDYEVGFARDVMSGRHSLKPALVAVGIGGAFLAWMVFSMGQDGIGLGEKLAILGPALLFWVIWVAFADASLSTARAQFRRYTLACTLALLIFAYMAALPFANAVVVCVEVGSITPVYGMIGIRFLFAPFVTEVALRLFLTVAEAAGKIAGSRKKGPAEDPANEPEQPAGEKNADD